MIILSPIKRAWLGGEKLWRVFWFYQFNVVFIYGAIFLLNYYDVVYELKERILYFILALFIVWIQVALWRCAFNVNWVWWGYLVRLRVIIIGWVLLYPEIITWKII